MCLSGRHNDQRVILGKATPRLHDFHSRPTGDGATGPAGRSAVCKEQAAPRSDLEAGICQSHLKKMYI